MADYYLNLTPQNTGEYEVHEHGCYWLSLAAYTKYLGDYATCRGAVSHAKALNFNADGCKHCSPLCHTR